MGVNRRRGSPRASSWTSRCGRKVASSASAASGGASLTSTRPGRLRWTESATASRYIRGERVTSTRIMGPSLPVSRTRGTCDLLVAPPAQQRALRAGLLGDTVVGAAEDEGLNQLLEDDPLGNARAVAA